MKNTALTFLLLGLLAWTAATGAAPAPAPAQHEHPAVSEAPATAESKGPAPDDGQWHFAGEPMKQSSIHPILLTPLSRPAMVPHAVQPAPKPAALKPGPLIETETYKPVSTSLQVRPPAVVAHHGPSFNDQPHRGPNPPVIVGVAANAKNANTGAINGTAFHRKF